MTTQTLSRKRRQSGPQKKPAALPRQLHTLQVTSYEPAKYRLVNCQDKSVWRGTADKGWQNDDGGPIYVLVRHAAGQVSHLNAGLCPDEIEGRTVRDDRCPVCQALVALGY